MISGNMDAAEIPETVRTQSSEGIVSIGRSHEVNQTSGMARERTNRKTILAENTLMQFLARHRQIDAAIAMIHTEQEMPAKASCPRHVSAIALTTNQQDAPRAPRNQPFASQ